MRPGWTVLLLMLLTLPVQAEVKMFYLHNDHLGTPRVVTDDQKNVVWKGHEKPFGEMEVEIESITNHRRFPGQRFDIESRLYYNYYRDYDPSLGTYIQSDPRGVILDFSDPQRQVATQIGLPIPGYEYNNGLNHLYGYAGQNPLSYSDPTGEALLGIGRVGWAAIGGLLAGGKAWYNSYKLEQCLETCRDKYCEQTESGDTSGETQCRMNCAKAWTSGFGNKKAPLPKRM